MMRVLRRRKDVLEVAGREIRLDPSSLIGSGGEAEVFDIGGGIALKVFKQPYHADLAGSSEAQVAAADRLDEHQTKLPALMSMRLPPSVVKPQELATLNGQIAGYTMPLIPNAEVLLRYGDRTLRAGIADDAIVGLLRRLHATVNDLHRAGVVIGDFNDLNVLVSGTNVHLIDADSMQFGQWRCSLFTARFLDPRLTDGRSLQLRQPHDEESDWYAFAVMAFQSLLFTGPYGGVYRPKAGGAVPHDHRPLRRISVFHPDVIYPRNALPLTTIRGALLDYFRAVFERDVRGIFPVDLLEPARPATVQPVVTILVQGRVTAQPAAAMPEARSMRRHWIADGTLWREGSLGPEAVGQVLSGRTRIWTGSTFGFGFYRASEMTVAFLFDSARRGIRDDIPLPRIRGQIVDAHAVFSEKLCWFFLATHRDGRLFHRCTVIRRDGSVVASLEVEPNEGHWLTHLRGHAAAGEYLLAATDEGIVRIEIVNGTLAATTSFPDSARFVAAGTHLAIGSDGLYATDGRRTLRLTLT